MHKILYLVLIFFLGGFGVHKYLNGRIVPGIAQLILCFVVGIGFIIALIEFIYDIIKLKSDENGEIAIPMGFFDFL